MLGAFGMVPKGTMSARALPLAQELTARGWRTRLIVPPWDAPAEAGRRHHEGGVEIVNARLDGGTPRIVARMVAAARAGRPAVIHCFKPKGHGGLAATSLRLAGYPLVVDNDDWEGRGGWNDRVPDYTPAHRLLFLCQAALLPRSAHAVTAASRLLEAQAWGQGVPPTRVHYVPNGLSPQRHAAWRAAPGLDGRSSRADYGLDEGPVILLYTRFDVVTPGRLARVGQAIRERCPAARLLVVGSGLADEDERARVEARRAGVADMFRWAGFVAFERLPATLRLADVAIYPIDDTLINRAKAPMKLLEVMGLGLPVVAEAVGETREYIVEGESGLLVESGDETALAARVDALLSAPEARTRLGEGARERVWTRHAWDALVERVERAYDACIAAAGRRQGGGQR